MSSYTRELIEALLPTIWDRTYAWGMVDSNRPDPDMPKGTSMKNRGNTLWAHLADIRRAWDNAALTQREAQALVLCGGLGLDYVMAGVLLGTHRRTVQYGFERGVGRLADYLNGTTYADMDADDDE